MNANKRIAIFDDDQDLLTIMKYVLERKGWTVFSSSDSTNMLEKISTFQPAVIIMDNNIPEYGGVVNTQLIKQQQNLRHIPVIIFTANDDIENLAKEAGADAWLPKPFHLENLYEVIGRIRPETLAQLTHTDSRVTEK